MLTPNIPPAIPNITEIISFIGVFILNVSVEEIRPAININANNIPPTMAPNIIPLDFIILNAIKLPQKTPIAFMAKTTMLIISKNSEIARAKRIFWMEGKIGVEGG